MCVIVSAGGTWLGCWAGVGNRGVASRGRRGGYNPAQEARVLEALLSRSRRRSLTKACRHSHERGLAGRQVESECHFHALACMHKLCKGKSARTQIYTQVHTHVCTHTHTHAHTHLHTHTHAHTHTCTRTHSSAQEHTHAYTCTQTYTHLHTNTQHPTCKHTYTCTHTFAHTNTLACGPRSSLQTHGSVVCHSAQKMRTFPHHARAPQSHMCAGA